MEESFYPFKPPRVEYRYDFVSVSADKEISKIVLFTLTNSSGVYNLALLDLLPDGQTSDMSETKNKDMRTVLATVVQIVMNFLDKNPLSIVLFQGSDQKRQRLYRIIINQEFERINQQFRVFGSINGQIESFEPNRPYSFFS